MPIVQGKAMWAAVQAPNTQFEPVYSIDVVVNEEDAETLQGHGLKVKEKDGELIFKVKRKLYKADGTQNNKPKVVDAQNAPFAGLIGNGSTVNVKYSVFEWNNKFGQGVGADLQGVQVVELVEFGDNEDFSVVDGFVAQPTKSSDADSLPFDED